MEITNTEYMVYATLFIIGSFSVTLVAMIYKASNIVEDGKNRKSKPVVLAEDETGARNNDLWERQFMYSTSDMAVLLRLAVLVKRALFLSIAEKTGSFLQFIKRWKEKLSRSTA